MKTKIIIPSILLLLSSCNSEPTQNFDSKLEEIIHEAESDLEGELDESVEFNNKLFAELTIIEVEIVKIIDIDEKNIPENKFVAELKSSLEIAEKVEENLANMDVFYNGGKAFLDATVNYVDRSKKLMEFYLEHSTLLSIDEEEWTTEEYNEYIEISEPIIQNYIDAYDNFTVTQEVYAEKNNILLEEDTDYDPETLYEESKEN